MHTGLVALTVPPTLPCVSPSPQLFFDHCSFFSQVSLLLWLCVCVSYFLPFPGYHLDFDLHHRLTHPLPPSCSSFAVHLSSSPIHLMSLYLLFLWISSIAYFLMFPHTNTSTHTNVSQPRSPGIIVPIS